MWSMAVSIGGGFTGKPHHEVSLFFLSVSFFCSLISTSFIFCANFFLFLFRYFFCNLCNNFLRSINTHNIWAITGVPRQPYEGLHIIMFICEETHTNASYPAMDISCMSSRGRV